MELGICEVGHEWSGKDAVLALRSKHSGSVSAHDRTLGNCSSHLPNNGAGRGDDRFRTRDTEECLHKDGHFANHVSEHANVEERSGERDEEDASGGQKKQMGNQCPSQERLRGILTWKQVY